MRLLAGVAALAAAASGVAVAVLASLAYPPVVALAAAALATVGLCSLLGWRSQVVPAGLLCLVGVGAAILAPEVPPDYPTLVGAAVLAGAGVGVLAIEVGTRAGVVVDARGTGDTPYGRLWFWPAAAIAVPYLLWRRGVAGRAFVLATAAAVVGANPVAVWAGRGVAVEAATLAPVVVVTALVLPATDTVAYVSPDLRGSVVHRVAAGLPSPRSSRDASPADDDSSASEAGSESEAETAASSSGAGTGEPAGAGTAADADESADARGDRGADVVPETDEPTGGDDPTGADDVAAAGAAVGADETATVGAAASADEAAGGADPGRLEGGTGPGGGGDATTTAATSGSASPDPDDAGASGGGSTSATDDPWGSNDPAGGAGASTERVELAPCQNCGDEHPDRAPRYVVTSPACTVVLCPDCERRRLENLRTFDECRGPSVHGAIADDDACAACGTTVSTLEAHPVVPLDAGGHRHPNNITPLCHGCHVAAEVHRVARRASRAPRRG